jgi:putative ABC transport system permease protein
MFRTIVWRNLLHKPLPTLLSIILLAFSVGMMALLLLLQRQIGQKFSNDLRDTDLVLGAKGSPLQLVLSAIYHIDAPTGNINLAEANKIRRNPLVKSAIPLAYGDSYRGFRIVGTDSNYLAKYDARLQTGRLFQRDLEVVLGARVARQTGLSVGQTFYGTHGEAEQGEVHEEFAYTVVGVLAPVGAVVDNLLLTGVSSVWAIHEHGGHGELDHGGHGENEHGEHGENEHGEHGENEHGGHGENEHGEHGEKHGGHGDHKHDEAEVPDSLREITALLLKFRSPMAMMTVPRQVNETTMMQAASPSLEINRLLGLLGIGVTTLQGLAVAILLLSGLSVFIALFSRLRERRYELALLRSMGCSRGRLFGLLLAEGLTLALLGFAAGWLLSRFGVWMLNRGAADDLRIIFDGRPVWSDLGLLAAALAVGFLAALIPAWKAYRMDISTALAE